MLLLAVGMVDGNLFITRSDLEFEGDDQRPLSKGEQRLFKASRATFEQHKNGFEQALHALHIIFAGRLYREKCASFDKFFFTLGGMALPEDKLAKLQAKASKLSLTLGRK